ncbi:MAG: beta-hydroxyacyl-ACP dehydratase [Tannerella sp.]|jgi:3-hydroxyacyl-[acyl-carrier-protein] dehydratase|nr:beta-hydroxyacyl-ACP dehydratase [Tannerella sp.]
MINLVEKYYKIESCAKEGEETIFRIALMPDYCAYKGHFPGNPVSPGVCNIQMIKELAEKVIGLRTFIAYIAQCRFSAVITPDLNPFLTVGLLISGSENLFKVKASISDGEQTFMEFKGELTTML